MTGRRVINTGRFRAQGLGKGLDARLDHALVSDTQVN